MHHLTELPWDAIATELAPGAIATTIAALLALPAVLASDIWHYVATGPARRKAQHITLMRQVLHDLYSSR